MTGTARAPDRPVLRWRAEAMPFVAAYLVYWTARWIFVGGAGTAQANARAIWELEQKTGTAIELSVQRAFDSGAVNVISSNLYLAAQIADLRWIGAAANAAELWTLIRRTAPSLVVLDVHHPGRGGLELCAELKATVPTPTVLIYTSEEHEDLKIAAQLVGADGVTTKDESRRALLEAIRLAGRGESGPIKVTPSLRARAASRLDPTDRAIFAMRLAGTAPAEIASTTGLSSAESLCAVTCHACEGREDSAVRLPTLPRETPSTRRRGSIRGTIEPNRGQLRATQIA